MEPKIYTVETDKISRMGEEASKDVSLYRAYMASFPKIRAINELQKKVDFYDIDTQPPRDKFIEVFKMVAPFRARTIVIQVKEHETTYNFKITRSGFGLVSNAGKLDISYHALIKAFKIKGFNNLVLPHIIERKRDSVKKMRACFLKLDKLVDKETNLKQPGYTFEIREPVDGLPDFQDSTTPKVVTKYVNVDEDGNIDIREKENDIGDPINLSDIGDYLRIEPYYDSLYSGLEAVLKQTQEFADKTEEIYLELKKAAGAFYLKKALMEEG